MKVTYYVPGKQEGETDTELITTNGPVPREGETVKYQGDIWRVDRVIYLIGDIPDAHEIAVNLAPRPKP